MNKLVYLHELDSIRNTPEEILLGQQAMYEEIVLNGNCVVLTYNQFTDSKAFLCAVKNEEQYQHILELFKKGYIKLSNFVMKENENQIDIYTPSQYFQHALEKNIEKKQSFIFSGLRLNGEETELMTIMRDALKYSNPSIFERYEPTDTVDAKRIDELKKYIRLLLAISVEELAYNPIKRDEKLTLEKLMEIILNTSWKEFLLENTSFAALFSKAISILKEVRMHLTPISINARSNWLRNLYEKEKTQEIELAEAIVNMAYNYAVEDSISNVSKHYDDSESMNGLLEDFAHRISIYWKEHTEQGLHELHQPGRGAEGTSWEKILSWDNFPQWETAVRVTEEKKYFKKKAEADGPQKTSRKLYEENYETDRKTWGKKLIKNIVLQILIAFAYIILIHIFNLLTGGLEDIVAAALGLIGLDLGPVVSFIVNMIIYTVLLGVFSSYISKIFNLPDILESVDDISNSLDDIKNVRAARKYKSYVWLKEKQLYEK